VGATVIGVLIIGGPIAYAALNRKSATNPHLAPGEMVQRPATRGPRLKGVATRSPAADA